MNNNRILVKDGFGGRLLTKAAFKKEALAAGMTQDHIDKCVLEGEFIPVNMQIKVCPECQVIRKTSCCACGCGHCYTCGYRWWCLPPNWDYNKMNYPSEYIDVYKKG